MASQDGHTEVVKLLIEQEGIDINEKNIWLFWSMFISIILDFKIIFGKYSNYYGQHLFGHLEMDT